MEIDCGVSKNSIGIDSLLRIRKIDKCRSNRFSRTHKSQNQTFIVQHQDLEFGSKGDGGKLL